MTDTTEALRAFEDILRSADHPPGVNSLAGIVRAALTAPQAELDRTYTERNQIVAALSKLFHAGLARTNIPGWEPEWHGCVYIDLPTGQVSWHYHERDADLFSHLGPYQGKWDGHDTPEKYRRLAALTAPAHDLYKTGDADAPDVIKDRNGEVVLGLCRRCNKGEVELDGPCVTAPARPVGPIPNLTFVRKPFETHLTIREADGDRELNDAEVQMLYAIYQRGVALSPWRAVADRLAKSGVALRANLYGLHEVCAEQLELTTPFSTRKSVIAFDAALAAYAAAREQDKS